VKLDGPAGRLEGHLLHYTARSYAEHKAKLEFFSTMAAEDMFSRGRKGWRAAMIFAPPWTFFQRLLFQLGVLDGRRGWLIAWQSANYIYIKYRKLGRLRAGEKLNAPLVAESRRGLSVRPLLVDLGRDYRGGQHQALLLLQGLQERGHAPELITLRDSLLARRAKDAGVSVQGVPPGMPAPCCRAGDPSSGPNASSGHRPFQ